MIPDVHSTDDLLHAYLFEGEPAVVQDALRTFLEGLGVPMHGNPDAHTFLSETLTISEGRRLRDMAARQAVGAAPKVFITGFHGATREAQNALLKLLEEPPARTHFFIVVPSTSILLPTLRSRLAPVTVAGGHAIQEDVRKEARAFLKATPQERMNMVKPTIDEKDRIRARSLLDGVEAELYARTPLEQQSTEQRAAIAELVRLRRYLDDRAPSLRQILEHVALTV